MDDYKYALDQSAIVAITDTKGDIEYVNEMFCTLSKYSEDELRGQNQRIVNSGYHSREFWKEMWATICKGKVWRNEIRNKAKDGSIYWVDTTIVPFIGANGKPEKYIAIRYDITDKKKKEEELKHYRKELEKANSNLEQFANTAAHDMKSPLNSAISLINLIEKELGEENKVVTQYLKLLKETNERSKRLINGILDYSKISFSGMEPEKIDLAKLIKEATAQYQANEQVIISIDDNLPIVMHYETALFQVINNLLSNAVKYNDKESCMIAIKCTEKPDCYELSIEDNGPGIKEEERKIIFDLFENLKTKQEASTGIGLATVMKVVSETNGRIWVEPSESQGAKFVFTINKSNNATLKN